MGEDKNQYAVLAKGVSQVCCVFAMLAQIVQLGTPMATSPDL